MRRLAQWRVTLNGGPMSIKQIAATVALLGERPDEYPRWPWATFNREVGGLPPGRLTVIGARPGQGKTTMLLNAVRRWLEDGLKVCYLGTEQSFEETWQRLAALELAIPPVLFLEHRWDEIAGLSGRAAWKVEIDATEMVMSVGRRWGRHMWCVDLPRLSAAGFLEVAEKAVSRGADLIVLDHVLRLRYDLQMLTAAVGDLVTEAKECATRHKIHVVLAAQLARPPASLGLAALLTPPRADQLKQSGTLEQEADVVLLLHRVPIPDVESRLGEVRAGRMDIANLFQEQVLGVTVGKQRHRSYLTDRMFKLWVEPWDEIVEQHTYMREPGEEAETPF